MVHNGIEYGLMQAYAEGFDILCSARTKELPEEHRFKLDLADIAEVWRRGSVVGSWLLDLTAMALTEDPHLEGFTGFVQDSGEGRWTIMAAIEEAVPADVLAASLFIRFRSRQEHTFAEKVLSAMRNKFGGHLERPSGGTERDPGGRDDQPETGEDATWPSRNPSNPLTIGTDSSSAAQPCTLVIFGGSGDLSRRKLLPALYNLALDGVLPTSFAVVGFAINDFNDETLPGLRPRGGREVLAAADRPGTLGRLRADPLLRPRPVRRPAGLRGPEAEAGRGRAPVRHPGQPGDLPVDPPEPDRRLRRTPPRGRPGHAGRAGALHPDHRREAVRPRPGIGQDAERGPRQRLRRAARSSGSTTTSARRRCRA